MIHIRNPRWQGSICRPSRPPRGEIADDVSAATCPECVSRWTRHHRALAVGQRWQQRESVGEIVGLESGRVLLRTQNGTRVTDGQRLRRDWRPL